jgi:DNA-nicking Smr family endonuclease
VGTVSLWAPAWWGWPRTQCNYTGLPVRLGSEVTQTIMSNDDEAEFRRAMADVRPLRVRRDTPSPAAAARVTGKSVRAKRAGMLQDSLDVVVGPDRVDAGDELSFRRPGVRDDTVRRLRRGQIPVQAEIDLHGLTRHAAHDALLRFLDACVRRDLRCVRVIHGKGLRSGRDGPVLKIVVNQWLRKIENVAAFASARPADGGTGAVYVLLK